MIKKNIDGSLHIHGMYTIHELADMICEGASDYFLTGQDPMTSPDEVRKFLTSQLAHLDSELFCVMFMDNRHRVISFDKMFQGTIDGASVHPRVVVKRALEHNASAVILTHNHPSGITDPSQADIALTNRLKEALALIDVRVLDHFIVGDGVISFSERGMI